MAVSTTDTAAGTESATGNFSLGISGTIGQIGGTSTQSGTFALTQFATGTASLTDVGVLTGPVLFGTYTLTSSGSETANVSFGGSQSNTGGPQVLTETGSASGSSTFTAGGTFVSGDTTGTFTTISYGASFRVAGRTSPQ